jgi:preprotein translocase subunit YajC
MLINTVWAQDSAVSAGMGGQLFGFLPIILIFVIFYFLVLKPQNDEAKKHAKMVTELKKGDRVVTSGGIWGTIVKVSDTVMEIEIAEGVSVLLNRSAVLRVATEKEEKALPKTTSPVKKR